MQEDLGKHEFGNKNGCTANTRCDWAPCSCNLDQCLWCSVMRDHGSGKFEGETCKANTKAARDARAVENKKYHPDVPAIEGTDLKRESMVKNKAYEVTDFTSVPGCEYDTHNIKIDWSLPRGVKTPPSKDRTIPEGRVMINGNDMVVCNKCICF